MEIGLIMFPTGEAITPAKLAFEAEERGFESLWFPEHSHIPVSRRTPWGGREGAPPLPPEYWRSLDQFVALTDAAAATERIRIGTGICLVAQRDPIWTAKQVASLDHVSGGRFMFGVGYGWNVEEMANHGVPYRQRRAILREKVLAMQQIWSHDEAEFHGEHVDFDPIWSWPKPITKPWPPVILGGGAGPRTMRHIVEFCDGWMPIAGRSGPGELKSAIGQLQDLCEEECRDVAEVDIGIFGPRPDLGILEGYANLGVTRAVLMLPPAPEAEILPILDEWMTLGPKLP